MKENALNNIFKKQYFTMHIFSQVKYKNRWFSRANDICTTSMTMH